ncbi:MAG: bifunctional (p)ppGpp synthetase/guanosine-3',5'-bis(diphosphate) 3'-pyrophosphohydrolase [Nitrospinota bacterium]|nr:MAG: bifunctional (p)ppGpp synthetase/guanosine-3',5'-bis(diphosphate) 3'-pyrophosphohydrolase [Nitrospinota bacterium]
MDPVDRLIQRILSYNPHTDETLIRKAYDFAAKAHTGQYRKSGDPYVSHPLEVAEILVTLRMDSATIAAALLHDTVEDTAATLEEVEREFGHEVASLVDGVTKIGRVRYASKEERQAENFRKILLAMAKDIRVILIKLADRLHNMRTLHHLPPAKQQKIAQETLDIYAPLAHRLGIGWLKSELEDIAFRFLDPEAYKDIADKVASEREEQERYIEEVKAIIEKELEKAHIPGRVGGRPKHFYSIYRKMQNRNIGFEEVYDIIALRIITDSIRNCYAVLGLIHSLWTPIPGRFKDYIALPKMNMYQSLHTTVIGPHGMRVEFQIRTEEMHKTAEEGIAAHWRYKEGGGVGDEKYTERLNWLRRLLDWQQDLTDPKDFMEAVRIDLFPDEVYVFTPKGEVRSLPRGSTPIDFAYQIHTDVGHQCVGAKVNGRIVPLKYQLRNGDIVEILTNPNHTPSTDWLRIVKTSRARTKIKAWIKAKQKEESFNLGRDILEKEIQKYGVAPANYMKENDLDQVARRFGFNAMADLLAGIGYGKVSAHQVISYLLPKDLLEERQKKESSAEESEEEKFLKLAQQIGEKPADSGVKVKGIDEMLIRYAKCCHPVPGDEIVGFITRGRGVSIHTADCPQIQAYDPGRLIQVEWDVERVSPHPVWISVVTIDRPGLLAKITSAIADCGVNISQGNLTTTEDKRAFIDFIIDITDLNQLQQVIRNIRQIKDVLKVERVKGTHAAKSHA